MTQPSNHIRLMDIPRGSTIRVPRSDIHGDGIPEDDDKNPIEIIFDHLDGMYSVCHFTIGGKEHVINLAASTPLRKVSALKDIYEIIYEQSTA